MSAAKNDRCPLCGHRLVATLDHFLPKALYPALAVAPLNLVPACSDCNKAKHDAAPTTEEEVIIHPYFEDIEDEPWLYATVVETTPAAVSFFVRPPAGWSATLAARVKHHFRSLGLSKLYAAQAAEELLNIRLDLETVFGIDGAPAVADHLAAMARSREEAHTNSWQTAMYAALSVSEWFRGGGFR